MYQQEWAISIYELHADNIWKNLSTGIHDFHIVQNLCTDIMLVWALSKCSWKKPHIDLPFPRSCVVFIKQNRYGSNSIQGRHYYLSDFSTGIELRVNFLMQYRLKSNNLGYRDSCLLAQLFFTAASVTVLLVIQSQQSVNPLIFLIFAVPSKEESVSMLNTWNSHWHTRLKFCSRNYKCGRKQVVWMLKVSITYGKITFP